jgi:hypothetical protein
VVSDTSEPTPPKSKETLNARAALIKLREKREQITREYADGKINAAQYNAMYRYYMEKTAIIEKMLERDPKSESWRNVAAQGSTAFLRERFETRLLYCVVFRRGDKTPLLTEGRLPQKAAVELHKTLQSIWASPHWRSGVARKSLGEGMWLVLVLGERSFTMTIFLFQPANTIINKVRDLHTDFEQANTLMLMRGALPTQMVFPQRALFQTSS